MACHEHIFNTKHLKVDSSASTGVWLALRWQWAAGQGVCASYELPCRRKTRRCNYRYYYHNRYTDSELSPTSTSAATTLTTTTTTTTPQLLRRRRSKPMKLLVLLLPLPLPMPLSSIAAVHRSGKGLLRNNDSRAKNNNCLSCYCSCCWPCATPRCYNNC